MAAEYNSAVNPTPRRRSRGELHAAADEPEGTRFEELPETGRDRQSAVAAEPAWLADGPDPLDPEAGRDPATKAAQERHQAQIADSRRQEILGRDRKSVV